MKELNVIDFDRTLIHVDSFRLYVIHGIKKFRMGFLLYTLLRIVRIINAKTLKEKITRISIKNNYEDLSNFISSLLKLVNHSVLNSIYSRTNKNTINLICSASPDFYISVVANKLNMSGKGSYVDANNTFFHMYGKNKINYIISHFPPKEYKYNYAISDSKSDIELLDMFKNHTLHKN
ncbi:MAG: HAD family hydrolase [Candidatus Odinarchaeota archaeon]